MRREFKGRKRQRGFLEFIPAIGSVVSGLLGRKDAKKAQEQANKPIPTEQKINESTTRTAPDWLESFLTDTLFPQLSNTGPLYQAVDPNLGQFQLSPFMGAAALGQLGWMNNPMFGSTMGMGQQGLAQLLSGQNPVSAFSAQANPFLMQAMAGMLGVGNDNPLGYGSQLQNNLQRMIDQAFGPSGATPGGGYNSNLNTTPSNNSADNFRTQYLNMIASGRNDFLTPWGYGGAPHARHNVPQPNFDRSQKARIAGIF